MRSIKLAFFQTFCTVYSFNQLHLLKHAVILKTINRILCLNPVDKVFNLFTWGASEKCFSGRKVFFRHTLIFPLTMKFIVELWDLIYKESSLLAWIGALHFLLVPILIFLLQLDTRVLGGQNIWVKPIKFASSLAIYCWTMAAILSLFDYSDWSKDVISILISSIALVEIGIIIFQAFRGQASHFNVSTPLNSSLYSIMGIAIMINFLLLINISLDTLGGRFIGSISMRWGIQFGLVSIILASVIGGMMSAQMKHTVGMPDGGEGIPLLGWSREGGDLRVAHFLGIHGLQLLPLVAYFLSSYLNKFANSWIIGIGLGYLSLVLWMLIHALAGKPIL